MKLFLPSVMQNTRRKARSWAEMGGSVKCNAKTLDLKTTESEVRPTVPPGRCPGPHSSSGPQGAELSLTTR